MKLYETVYVCIECGNKKSLFLKELEIVFIQTAFKKRPTSKCTNCKNLKWAVGTRFSPKLTDEQMNIWSKNQNLSFFEQDEDILLSDIDDLDLILKYLNRSTTLDRKKAILFGALCTLYYDIMRDRQKKRKNWYNDQQYKKVKEKMIQHKSFWENIVNEKWYFSEEILKFISKDLSWEYGR